MRRPILAAAGLAAVTAGVALVSLAGPPATAPAARPISLTEVRERGIAGRLGPALGTVIKVEGAVVVDDSRAKSDEEEPFFLRVELVNGRPLETPQLYAAGAMPLARDVPGLKIGDRFRCAGYETGDFRGAADGEFDYVESYATQPFHFEPRFQVLKALGPK